MNVEKAIAGIPKRTAEERKTMRQHATALLQSGEPTQIADAQALLAGLDAIEAEEHAAFIGELEGMDVPERILRAFTKLPSTDTDIKAIQALLDNPGASPEQLSAECGWKDKSWHLHFGKMCERRDAYLPKVTVYGPGDTPFWSGIFANLDQGAHTWRWTMKPDVAAALAKLGIRPNNKGEQLP